MKNHNKVLYIQLLFLKSLVRVPLRCSIRELMGLRQLPAQFRAWMISVSLPLIQAFSKHLCLVHQSFLSSTTTQTFAKQETAKGRWQKHTE